MEKIPAVKFIWIALFLFSLFICICLNFGRICVNTSVDVVVVAIVTSGVAYQLSFAILFSIIKKFLLSRKTENESETYFYELCKRIQNIISYITLLVL